jgi:hypothetical protein
VKSKKRNDFELASEGERRDEEVCENIDYEKINDFGYVTILQNGGDMTECDN